MTVLNLTLNLPDQIASEARRAGLLDSAAVERLIEEAVRREAGKRLLDAMQRLRAGNEPLLTEQDVRNEIEAARAASRGERAG